MSGEENKKRILFWSITIILIIFIYGTLGYVRPVVNFLVEHKLKTFAVAFILLGFFSALFFTLIYNKRVKLINLIVVILVGIAYAFFLKFLVVMPEERIHFAEYGLVAFFLYKALKIDVRNKIEIFVIGSILLFLFGWGDELIQKLLPDRYYDLRDVFINFISGVLVFILMLSVGYSEKAYEEEYY